MNTYCVYFYSYIVYTYGFICTLSIYKYTNMYTYVYALINYQKL